MFDPSTLILVVDDFSSIRKSIVSSCHELGYKNILEAANGIEAWQAFCDADKPIGVILCDITMPLESGLDFLKRVRSSPRHRELPFIIISTESNRENILAAVSSGVSNFIVKPITTEKLKAKLEAVYQKMVSG